MATKDSEFVVWFTVARLWQIVFLAIGKATLGSQVHRSTCPLLRRRISGRPGRERYVLRSMTSSFSVLIGVVPLEAISTSPLKERLARGEESSLSRTRTL